MSTWQPIVDKFNAKLATWKGQFLSMGGRLTLINSVLSSLPLYYLSIMQLPSAVKKKLESIQRNFLWAGNGEKKKIHFVNWTTVCKPKSQGGLGILDLELKNRALLSKWLWRYANEPDYLWRIVVAAINKLNPSFMIPSGKVSNLSFLWKQISKPLLPGNNYHNFVISGFGHSLGNGTTISFWNDAWLENSTLSVLFPRIHALAVDKKASIASLGQWINDKWCWDIKLRRQPLSWEKNQWTNFRSFIEDIQPHRTDMDKVIWKHFTSGQYSSSSFYNSYQNSSDAVFEPWSYLWTGLAPPKTKTFCWQVLHGKLAVKATLHDRGIICREEATCPFCKAHLETPFHLFFNSFMAWEVWSLCCKKWCISWVSPGDVVSFFKAWMLMPLPNH
ncbi:Reverse transcriptase zinc-binding domain - like 2 [Theobroma cacao]|nr:Reverse transcriptase zinc-binding domain - like 2 [Theobroma cacao]